MAMDFPSGPTVGQIVSLGGNQYIWDGTAWNIIPQQAPAALSDLPPSNPAVGQFWWRGTNGQLYVYVNDGNSSQWVQAAGQGITPNVWELIKTIDFTGLTSASPIPVTDLGSFRDIRVTWDAIPVGGNTQFGLQFSNNNGSSYFTAVGDYISTEMYMTQLPGNNVGGGVTTASLWLLGSSMGTTIAASGRSQINRFNKPEVSPGNGSFFQYNTTNGNAVVLQGLTCQQSQILNALRVVTITGGVTLSGRVILEGVRG